jgi:hypothetical protein
VRISTSAKRMILVATSSDKWVLRGLNRLIHPRRGKDDSPKSVCDILYSQVFVREKRAFKIP